MQSPQRERQTAVSGHRPRVWVRADGIDDYQDVLPRSAERHRKPRRDGAIFPSGMPENKPMKHQCPVCGYAMPYAPEDYNICPCCGTEFGNDDSPWTIQELRNRWVAAGAPWFFRTSPVGWNPWAQLINAGYMASVVPPSFQISVGLCDSIIAVANSSGSAKLDPTADDYDAKAVA